MNSNYFVGIGSENLWSEVGLLISWGLRNSLSGNEIFGLLAYMANKRNKRVCESE